MEKAWKDNWKNSPGNGFNHYESDIQPIEYFASDLKRSLTASVIKYVVRHRKKNGREDLEKARWYVDWLNRSLGHREVHAGDFIAANKFEEDVKEIILHLERFEEIKDSDVVSAKGILTTVDNHILNLMKKYYE